MENTNKTSAGKLRSNAKYISKCRRIQVVLNPANTKDAELIAYMKDHDNGKPDATQIKDMLLEYIRFKAFLEGKA